VGELTFAGALGRLDALCTMRFERPSVSIPPLTDSSKVDILDFRYKFVNFGVIGSELEGRERVRRPPHHALRTPFGLPSLPQFLMSEITL